jgi:hypothetical protein
MSNITVLMIDDDRDNFDSLKNKAAYKNILLKYAESLEEMLDELKTNLKIDAVILDGKGFRKKGQVKGTEKEDFVHEALTELKMLERELDRIIPKCVYTAWYDQLKDSLESRVRVFDKKKLALDSALMDEFFEFLHSEVAVSSAKKIRTKYADVLAGIGGKYLPADKESSIIKLLSTIENNDPAKQSDFNTIRDVFESFLKKANAISFLPNDLIKPGGRPNLEWCCMYLSGKKTEIKDASENIVKTYPKTNSRVPDHIGSSIYYVKQISSIFSHDNKDTWTQFTFKSTALALAEIIIWFKNYIDSKYPNI